MFMAAEAHDNLPAQKTTDRSGWCTAGLLLLPRT